MKYAAKKFLMLLVTMVIVSFFAFFAFRLIGGDPATKLLGTEATPERLAALRAELGLDRPMLVQYFSWLGGFFTGDLGISYSYKLPVSQLVWERMPLTASLVLLSFLLITLISIPLGLHGAIKGEGRMDGLRTCANQLFMAVPPFFTGILITWVFGITLRWFTPYAFPGLSEHFFRSMWYLLFPAVAIAIPRISMTIRMLRSTVRTEMDRDYVRTAISRGNDRWQVMYRHVLKNSMVPVVSFLAQTMAELVVGGIVVEQVFNLPGLGRLLLSGISNRDYPVVQAVIVFVALWVVLANTVADLINRRIDPRMGGERE